MTATMPMPRNTAERRGRRLRLGDLALAATALVAAAPVMFLVALAILYESGTPVFFRQQRLGENGRCFPFLKFKTFRNDADPGGPHLTSRGDDRMTRIGALLQKTKFDEVPQFINVLRGEMAIIGPRPESLRFADCFDGRYREVLSHKPGILGPNQILFRNEDALFAGRTDVEAYYRQVLFPLKASVDLRYFARRALRSDLHLLVSAAGAICGLRVRAEHLILDLAGAPLAGAHPAQPKPRSLTDRILHRRDPADLDRSGAAS